MDRGNGSVNFYESDFYVWNDQRRIMSLFKEAMPVQAMALPLLCLTDELVCLHKFSFSKPHQMNNVQSNPVNQTAQLFWS